MDLSAEVREMGRAGQSIGPVGHGRGLGFTLRSAPGRVSGRRGTWSDLHF